MPTRALVTRYEDDLQLFPSVWHKIALSAVAIFILILFFFAGDHALTIANDALIAVVGASAMMILTGFCGQVSLGHGAFLALGAYTAAILGGSFGLPFWLIIPAAGAVAAVVGLAVGPFALRLEGLYLAIVTLGLLMIVEHALRNGLDVAYGKDYLSVPMHGWFAPGDTSLGSFRADSEVFGFDLHAARKIFALFVL